MFIDQSGDISAQQKKNGELSLWARALSSLAFVPVAEVGACFHALATHPEMEPRLRPVLAYFQAGELHIESIHLNS